MMEELGTENRERKPPSRSRTSVSPRISTVRKTSGKTVEIKTELLTVCCCLSICIQISFVVGNDEFSPCPFSSSTIHSLLKSVTVRINLTISIRIRTALVVQWLGVHVPLQGTQVRSLVCKDSTHRNSKISVPQLLNQSTLEPVLGN